MKDQLVTAANRAQYRSDRAKVAKLTADLEKTQTRIHHLEADLESAEAMMDLSGKSPR